MLGKPLRKKSLLEPYAFTGIKWATVKLTVASKRDLCYFDKMGMVRQRSGKRMAYHVMQSVDLPECPPQSMRKRVQMSLCYVLEELEDDLVGVYMQGECTRAKKLALIMATNRPEHQKRKYCYVCRTDASFFDRLNNCTGCSKTVCKRCRFNEHILARASTSDSHLKRAAFCNVCISKMNSSSLDQIRAEVGGYSVAELGTIQNGSFCKIDEAAEDVKVEIPGSNRSLASFVLKISTQLQELSARGDHRASNLSSMGMVSEDDPDEGTDVLNSSRLKSGQFVVLDRKRNVSGRSLCSSTSTRSSSFGHEHEDPEHFCNSLFAKLQQVTNQAEETLSYAREQSLVAHSAGVMRATPILGEFFPPRITFLIRTLHGRFDDVIEGIYTADTDEMLLMNAIKCPRLSDSAVRYTVQHHSPEDPYVFTGIKSATIKVSIASDRESCYFDKIGMVRQSSGKRMAYHVLQTVDLPDIPPISPHKRLEMSLCYLFEELEDDLVGVYMQGTLNYSALSFFARSAVSELRGDKPVQGPVEEEVEYVDSDIQNNQRALTTFVRRVSIQMQELTTGSDERASNLSSMGQTAVVGEYFGALESESDEEDVLNASRLKSNTIVSTDKILPEMLHRCSSATLAMTFPNRANYVPGQQRRDPKSVALSVEKPPTTVKRPLLSARCNQVVTGTDSIRQELNCMLSSLSPDGQASPLPMPTNEENGLDVKSARKRLMEDPTFQRNESFQQLLMFANNPNAPGFQPAPVDPLALLIERLPSSSMGFGGDNDTISTSERSRAQYVQAVAMQKMSEAAEQVQDATVQAQYTRTAHSLCEWGQRTMQLQRQQEEMESGMGTEPSPLSLSQVSPYAMELAVRNNTPKKRSSLSKKSKKLMQDWFEHNLHHPYPTEEEKEWLAREGGITLEQVNNWFINTRGRKWKPMLNRLMAEKQAGQCSLYDKMVKKIEEPYHKL
eukprot:jgi/Phyca11/19544/fgenesh1_pg.PHYCAscaffold_49_\